MTTLVSSLPTGRRINVLWSHITLAVLALIALAVHSYNMFGFPLYWGDEGIYMGQAYAVVKLGQITPYAYWYDHAPAGWLLLAIWSAFIGGFHTFGTAIDSGRVLMLILHLASLILMFRITLRLTARLAAATTASLLYALSPLSVFYTRMVLLDNIMVFWALLAMVLFLRHDGKIWSLLYSGLCLGIAVLSKEIAIMFLPAFLYGLWTQVERHHARFARATWLFAAISSMSLYLLYAALRKELIDWSFSSPLAGGSGSVSLLGALLWQASRSGGAPWNPSSDFYHMLTTSWLIYDPWLLGLGAAATLWNLLRGDHGRRMVSLMALLAFFGIAHGGVVYDFYIVPLLPFLAINVGLAIDDLLQVLQAQTLLPATVIAALAIGAFSLDHQRDMFTLNMTRIQREALAWVQEHVPPQSQIVIDDDLWVDLRDGAPGKPSFPGAHSHWKVANDPAVYKDLFYNDWHNIDYLVVTPGMDTILANDHGKLTNLAYINSTLIAHFSVGDKTVEIRKVNHAGIAIAETLEQSYRGFRDRFIINGQVQPSHSYTDARDQATAMLMAVWMGDRQTFDDLWTWTRMHLQNDSGLLFRTNAPDAAQSSSTDADTDTALALLLAEQRWKDGSYGRYGRQIVQSIWQHEVVEINGVPYLAAGDWAVQPDQAIFAPATFAPYAYHLFAAADPTHNWWSLLDNTYTLLNTITKDVPGQAHSGLPPAYIGIDRATGDLVWNPQGVPSPSSAFDAYAAEVYWRVGLDAQWHDDTRPDAFLAESSFLHNEWQRSGMLADRYDATGQPETSTENMTLYSAVLPKFMAQDPAAAHALYATKLAAHFEQSISLWDDGSDITQQRWAWLATGIYGNALKYAWNAGT